MNIGRIRTLSFVVLGLLLFPLFYLLSGRVKASDAFLDAFISVIVFTTLAYMLRYSTRFTGAEKSFGAAFFINHIVTGIVFSFVWMGVVSLLLIPLLPGKVSGTKEFTVQAMVWKGAAGLTFYFIVLLMQYLLVYYEENTKQVEREAELKTLITEAELKNLKFQINPHFLFNSLNSITALIMIDAGKARAMTISLAEFLRSTLSNNIKQAHTLLEELNNLRLYLSIEKIRFEDRFLIREEVPEELYGYKVPNMILQPLLENAVKYSVYESLEPVTILLSGKKAEGGMMLSISNDYENTPVPSMKKGEGVGLANVKSRLDLFYKGEASMEVVKGERSFSVNLYIPFKEQENN